MGKREPLKRIKALGEISVPCETHAKKSRPLVFLPQPRIGDDNIRNGWPSRF